MFTKYVHTCLCGSDIGMDKPQHGALDLVNTLPHCGMAAVPMIQFLVGQFVRLVQAYVRHADEVSAKLF